jgi:hypothetical protein
MGVAQNRNVNLFWIKWEATIAGGFLLAMALEETAFEQQFLAVDLEEIHGAGRGASSAEKVDLHGPTLLAAGDDVKSSKKFYLKKHRHG